jgi:hypothetical protein
MSGISWQIKEEIAGKRKNQIASIRMQVGLVLTVLTLEMGVQRKQKWEIEGMRLLVWLWREGEGDGDRES